jgi:hypothetical protein
MPKTQFDDERTDGARGRESSDDEDGTSVSYSDWQRQELLQRAHELDIGGRATMTKPELIDALHDTQPHGKSQRLPKLDHLRPGRRPAGH